MALPIHYCDLFLSILDYILAPSCVSNCAIRELSYGANNKIACLNRMMILFCCIISLDGIVDLAQSVIKFVLVEIIRKILPYEKCLI